MEYELNTDAAPVPQEPNDAPRPPRAADAAAMVESAIAADHERELVTTMAGAVYDATVKGGLVKVGWSSRIGWAGGAGLMLAPIAAWGLELGMPAWMGGLLVALGTGLTGLTNRERQVQAR